MSFEIQVEFEYIEMGEDILDGGRNIIKSKYKRFGEEEEEEKVEKGQVIKYEWYIEWLKRRKVRNQINNVN